ncbi:DUF2567 domain-containing protein [Solwaraspora sp. WMMD1047]|uniref:DUF2567 domain-containing protein n=1 Tax=Solwaraspora sp. WMMD1047 TaxID=3016102 RepID=UPI00241750F2|nr:DUF2567 domain-containing protein [Solwaraspora sp. WMMD1047]MDG4832126.1 DUF2567 domain-containing protein [Solwaraspora sp. WMMD1047]
MSPATSEPHPPSGDAGDGTSLPADPTVPAAQTGPTAAGPVSAGPVPAGPPVGGGRRPGLAALVGVATAAGITLLGLPIGLLWAALAPAVPVRKTADGAVLTQAQPEEFIAADGWFTLIGLCFGVATAIAVWLLLRRRRGPFGLIVAVLGALGAAVVAWQVGRRIGLAEYQRLLADAQVGDILNRPPDLRAGGFEWVLGVIPTIQGNLLLPAFGVAVMYTLLAGWSGHPSLRPEPDHLRYDAGPGGPPAGTGTATVETAGGFGAGGAGDVAEANGAAVVTDPGTASDVPAADQTAGGGEPPVVSWGSSERPAPAAAPAPPEPGATESPRG